MKNNPYQLTFTLKQHTPLIHFQHEQAGATLRATEMRPKLDKFLIKKFKEENTDYKKWLVGDGEHPALDYKIKIFSSNRISHYLPLALSPDSRRNPEKGSNLISYIKEEAGIDVLILAPSPYFANSDKIKYERDSQYIDRYNTKLDELRFGIIDNGVIKCQINSFHSNLVSKIESLISFFFLQDNFGTRQNKGFGSFTVESVNGKNINLSKEELKGLFISKSNNRIDDLDKMFQFINSEYRLLKSGDNFPVYQKSKLFNYFIDKKIRWEKRYLKKKINSNKILNKDLFWKKKSAPIDKNDTSLSDYNEWQDKQQNSYKYVRALLGLSEQFEYTVFAERRNKNGDWEMGDRPDSQKKYVVTLENKPKGNNSKIERFKSPIFFKVINGVVYINADNSFQDLLGEKFEFKLKLKGDNGGTINNLGYLNVPDSFNVVDFLKNNLSNKWTRL